MTVPAAGTIEKKGTLLARHPAVAYFILTFTISWLSALAVAAPHLFRHESLTKLTGVLMFPAMLLGPPLTSLVLTAVGEGRAGLRQLASRLLRWRILAPWYAVLLLPPVLVLSVLLCLQAFVSTSYAPNRFLLGVLFGIPAGIFEEVGWTGYAFPKLALRFNPLAASTLLGILWAVWHLPSLITSGRPRPTVLIGFRFSWRLPPP